MLFFLTIFQLIVVFIDGIKTKQGRHPTSEVPSLINMFVKKLLFLLTKQDVVDEGHIARGDLAVAVLVTIYDVA